MLIVTINANVFGNWSGIEIASITTSGLMLAWSGIFYLLCTVSEDFEIEMDEAVE
jgi:hypothetical protein